MIPKVYTDPHLEKPSHQVPGHASHPPGDDIKMESDQQPLPLFLEFYRRSASSNGNFSINLEPLILFTCPRLTCWNASKAMHSGGEEGMIGHWYIEQSLREVVEEEAVENEFTGVNGGRLFERSLNSDGINPVVSWPTTKRHNPHNHRSRFDPGTL